MVEKYQLVVYFSPFIRYRVLVVVVVDFFPSFIDHCVCEFNSNLIKSKLTNQNNMNNRFHFSFSLYLCLCVLSLYYYKYEPEHNS